MRVMNVDKKLATVAVTTLLFILTFIPIVNAHIATLQKSSIEATNNPDAFLESMTLGDIKQLFQDHIVQIKNTGVNTEQTTTRLNKAFDELYSQGVNDDTTVKELSVLIETGLIDIPSLIQFNLLCKITSFCLIGVEFDIEFFMTGMVWVGASLSKSYDSQLVFLPDQKSLSLLGLVLGFTGSFDEFFSFPVGSIELKAWLMQGNAVLVFVI